MKVELYTIKREILYKELQPLFESLSSIRYAVVKGEALSQQIYGVPNRRRSNDIDILVDRNNVHFIENELRRLGFEQYLIECSDHKKRLNRIFCMTCSHQIPSYHKEKYGFNLNVDINYDIFWGEYQGQRYSIDDYLCDTVDMVLYGVPLKTLPIEKAFLQLVLHHYKEMNSIFILSQYNTITTCMFSDIYRMLINNIGILNVECLRKMCEHYSVGRYLYYMLYYTYLVFNTPILNAYLSELINYRDENLIMSFGLNQEERKKWIIEFEERLDNKNIPHIVQAQLLPPELEKVAINSHIFN